MAMTDATTSTTTTDSTPSPTTTNDHDEYPNWRLVTVDDLKQAQATDTLSTLLGPSPATWNPTVARQSRDWYQHLVRLEHDKNGHKNDKDNSLQAPVQAALDILHNAHRMYQGGAQVFCSFNGGKDACVVLELMRAAHAHYYSSSPGDHNDNQKDSTIPRPRAVFWDKEGEFPAVLDFVQTVVQDYDLDMIVFGPGISFVQGLQWLVGVGGSNPNNSDNNKTNVVIPLAFVLGTRTGDPNAHGQGSWEPSSASYMPPFLRVNPLLHTGWDYGTVWDFLLHPVPNDHDDYKDEPKQEPPPPPTHLPICRLYQQGYTSLGTIHDTLPNPALLKSSEPNDNNNDHSYWPAWNLTDYSLERAGRTSASKPNDTKNQANTTQSSSSPRNVVSPPKTLSSTVSNVSMASTWSAVPKSTTTKTRTVGATNPTNDNHHKDTDVTSIALVVIGDEILKGYTVDTNSQVTAATLRTYETVALHRVSVISDDEPVIRSELERLLQDPSVDYIVTSGGIGPTHDDVTLKSVASALGCELEWNIEMAQFLWDQMGSSSSSSSSDRPALVDRSQMSLAQLKMATLPQNAQLRYLPMPPTDNDNDKDKPPPKIWPILQCRTIFILPGIPDFFEPKLKQVLYSLAYPSPTTTTTTKPPPRSSSFKVLLSQEETTIVSQLNQVVERHEDQGVVFGSYPFVNQTDYKTVITIEGKRGTTTSSTSTTTTSTTATTTSMDERVQRALEDLIASLPDNAVVRVDADDLRLSSSSSSSNE